MRYIRAHSNVPVPRVYDLVHYSHRSWIPISSGSFVLMENLSGATLSEVLPQLDGTQRGALIQQLADCLDALRARPKPPQVSPTQVCYWLDGKGAMNPTMDATKPIGPFDDPRAFNDFLLSCVHRHYPNYNDHTRAELAQTRAEFPNDCHVVFSYGELLSPQHPSPS